MSAQPVPFFYRTVSPRTFAQMAVLFGAYLAAAILGGALFHAPAVIFPAAAIALAGLVIGGMRLWPAVTLASLVGSLYGDVPFLISFVLAAGHTVQAVTGARLLQIFGFDPVFRRVRDMFTFMGTAFVTTLIVPAFGFFGFFLTGLLTGIPMTIPVSWFSWWMGLFFVDLVLASAAIRWFAKPRFERTRIEITELTASLAMMLAATFFLFWTDTSWMGAGVAILIFFVPLVWFVLRHGMRFTLLAFSLTAITGITGILYGWAPSTQEIGRRLLTGEIFIAAVAAIFFLFVAVVEERKRSAKEVGAQLARVNDLLEDAKRADRAKSEFIAVFAHELRNPLSPIVSATELLKLRFGAHPEIAPVIETLSNRTATIVHLLDDLLDLARISQGKLRLRKEEAALCDITRRSALSMENHFHERGQTLAIETPTVPIRINVDPVRIEQIVNNLLSNASKFSPEGSRIELTVHRAGAAAEIGVKDYGIGIPADMIPRIFEPFLQIETQVRNSGLGIGLSLTKKLVEEHGGIIESKSEGNGRGSEFIVSLPLHEEKPSMSPVINFIQPMEPLVQKTSMRILVVDDNEAAANGLGTLLTHVGNTVECVYVGADVAGKTAEFKPDVIVLDIGLPDMSGYEVAEELRKGGYTGRIIALTGYGQDEDKQKATAAGFDHHLTKPVGLADLQAVLMPQAA